jgi:hypothetical protein
MRRALLLLTLLCGLLGARAARADVVPGPDARPEDGGSEDAGDGACSCSAPGLR